MKTIFKSLAVALLLIAATNLEAARSTYKTALVDEKGLAYSNTYTLDTFNLSLDQLSWQAVYATTTFSAATFNDGTASTGSITVVSTAAIHGVAGSNVLTVVSGKNSALAAVAATDSFFVVTNSTGALKNAYVTLNGKKLYINSDWFMAPTANGTAVSLSNAINANTNFRSVVSGSSVTITCAAVGTYCNSYTLASSTPTALTAATAKFTGGQDAVYFTLNGRQLKNGIDWSTGFSSTNTATSLATAVGTVNGFGTNVSSNVVTITCTSSGTFCNAYTLATSSAAALAVRGALFTGGVNPVRLAINGTVLTEGVDFTATDSSDTTAGNIASAINANSTLAAIIAASTGPMGVVTTTSTAVGAGTKYSLWSSNYAGLRPFAPAMKGGTKSAVVTGSGMLNIASHGYTTALPVLYTTSAGTSPRDLVANTTYFVIPVDVNDFKLATTGAKAQAGTADVRLSTQSASGAGSFALTPLPFSGTPSFKWQMSNDDVNWYDMAVTSVTFSSPYTASNAAWDFGSPNYMYYRLNVIGPTQGGMKLVVTGNGRSNRAYRP